MSTEENTHKSNARSTLATFIVMGCTFLSRLLGFVRNALIASLFGAGGEASILHLTFAVPNNLRRLMAEGALSSAFIPEISRALVEEPDGNKARYLTRLLIGFQIAVLVPLCVFAVIFADPLIRYVLSELSDPAEIRLAVDLFRWFIFYILLISINATMMAVLNSHGRFFVPAFTPVLFSIAVISSLVLFYSRLGVFAMAVGVLFGGLGQIIFQLPFLLKQGYSVVPSFTFTSPGFKRVMRRWGPVVAASSVFSIIQIIAIRFASGIDEKGVAGLQNAIIFWQLPMGIFSASVTTVMFPRMSRQFAQGEAEALDDTIRLGIDLLMILLIPSMLVLLFLGEEIIAVAYQRNKFGISDTIYTYQVLKAYTFGLFSVGAFNFLQRYYFSAGNFRRVTITAFIVALTDIGLSLWLKETFLGVAGLAYANTAAFTLGFLILYLPCLRNSEYGLLFRNLKTLGKIMISMLPGTLVFMLNRYYSGNWWHQGATIVNLFRLMIPALLFSVVSLGMYKIFKVEAINLLFRRKQRRVPIE
jgi:putative peptidoglycan lipid II flippase